MKIHIYNALKYEIVVQCKDPENRVNWGTRHQIQPSQGKEVHDVKPFEKRPRLQIEVYDENKKLIKETNFQTPFVPLKGISWVVKENGVVEQKWGADLWVENPSGKKFLWERNIEATKLQCTASALEKRLFSEKAKLTEKEKHIDELEKKVEQFTFNEQKYTEELQEQQARCQNLEQQMNGLQHDRDQFSELEQKKQELEKRLQAEQAIAQENAVQLNELKQRVEGFAFFDQRRVEELEKQQAHCQKLQEQISYLNYDLNQFSKLKEEKLGLQEQLANLKKALVAQQMRSAVKGQTKEQFQALEQEKQDLQQQVEALGQKLNALEQKQQERNVIRDKRMQERQEKYKRRQRRFLEAVSKNEPPAKLEKLANKQLISRTLLKSLKEIIQQGDVNELISLLNKKQFEQEMLRFLRFDNDNTALHIAVAANKVNMVQHFVTHPEIMPKLNAVNKDNKSALDIAREKGFDQIVKMLQKFSQPDAYISSTSIPYSP